MSTLLVTRNEDKTVTTSFEEGEFLSEGDLTVDVSYSSLNYKDAMAIAGDRGVMRTSPLVPGIDVVGTVAESSVERLPVGTLVASFGDGPPSRSPQTSPQNRQPLSAPRVIPLHCASTLCAGFPMAPFWSPAQLAVSAPSP